MATAATSLPEATGVVTDATRRRINNPASSATCWDDTISRSFFGVSVSLG
jgi:hypothetical protein